MFKRSILFFLLLAPCSALAISNIESQRPGPPPEGWSGTLELIANGKTGNVDESRYGVGGRLVFKANDNTVFGILEKSEGRTQDIKTSDEAFAHARWIHQATDRTALEGFVQWQENEFDSLLSRHLVGAGGRFGILAEPDRYTLDLGLGVFHEWEHTDLGTYTERQERWRLNTYWVYKHELNENVNWFSTLYFQPNVEDFSDQRALFEAGVAVRLTRSLHLRFNYNVKYNSHPPQNLDAMPPIDRASTNTEYTTSFLYEF